MRKTTRWKKGYTYCDYIYMLDRNIKNVTVVVARSVVRSAAVLLQGPRGLCVQQSSHVADHSVQSEMRESVRLHETQARVQVIIYVVPVRAANTVFIFYVVAADCAVRTVPSSCSWRTRPRRWKSGSTRSRSTRNCLRACSY